MVSATEIASFVYCPEQWRLQHGLGNESENTTALNRGEAFHTRTASAVVRSRQTIRLGIIFVALAAALLLAARFLLRR